MANILKILPVLIIGASFAGAAAGSECATRPVAMTDDGGALADAKQKVEIEADEITFPRRNVVKLRGYTQLIRGGQRVYADELEYDKADGEVEARGVVKFQSPQGDVIRTSVLRYDINQSRAVSGRANFSIAARKTSTLGSGDSAVNAHGTADRVVFERGDVMRLENAVVTTCLDGKDDITFTAQDIKVDLNQGIRTARRAKVQILAPERHSKLKGMIN